MEDYTKHEKLTASLEQTGTGQKKKSAFKRQKISKKLPQQPLQVDSRIQLSTFQQYPDTQCIQSAVEVEYFKSRRITGLGNK